MNTLIVPCAGKSNRFPNMKPKWMLTHPDGELMLQKALSGINLENFERIIITIVKPHCEKYEADIVLRQVFKGNSKIELCILEDFTSSASETIFQTINKMNLKGAIVIKDSDNNVKIELDKKIKNLVAGYDLHEHPNISNIPGKSFLIVNKQNIIEDIIEKKVISNIICVGVYAFSDVEIFKKAYIELKEKDIKGELFISHVISYILSKQKEIFECKMAKDYEDWGTLFEWQKVQKNYRTYFIDVDGVLMKNCGKYGSKNWSNNEEVILENIQAIQKLQSKGAQIIITTSRTEEYKDNLEKLLRKYGLKPYAIITGINHAARVLINDFAPTNPYPSSIAITIPRNSKIEEYLQ